MSYKGVLTEKQCYQGVLSEKPSPILTGTLTEKTPWIGVLVEASDEGAFDADYFTSDFDIESTNMTVTEIIEKDCWKGTLSDK